MDSGAESYGWEVAPLRPPCCLKQVCRANKEGSGLASISTSLGRTALLMNLIVLFHVILIKLREASTITNPTVLLSTLSLGEAK